MNRTKSPRTVLGALSLAILALIVAMNLGGCSNNETSPTAMDTRQAPALPDAEALQFDFSFFDAAASLDKTDGIHDNFINAYLRAVVLGAMAKLTLAAPVTVFAAALHTTPVALDDGTWVWDYAWQDAHDSVLITLSGLPVDGYVEWELRLSGNLDNRHLDNAVWFTGTTRDAGQTGHWYFNDFEEPGHPLVGEIAWGDDGQGRFLSFISREEGSDGNTLRFRDADPDYAIEFTDVALDEIWHIQWHADGSGSLRVPLYNGGENACWDTNQRNADCF